MGRQVWIGVQVAISGLSSSFDLDRASGLLQIYGQEMKMVPPEDLPTQRFISFFQKHRRFGRQETFLDVVLSGAGDGPGLLRLP
jgi:hypothetical protein